MTSIFIMTMWLHGTAITTQEYSTKESCEASKVEIQVEPLKDEVPYIVCTKK